MFLSLASFELSHANQHFVGPLTFPPPRAMLSELLLPPLEALPPPDGAEDDAEDEGVVAVLVFAFDLGLLGELALALDFALDRGLPIILPAALERAIVQTEVVVRLWRAWP